MRKRSLLSERPSYNIKLNTCISVTQDHYEASIKNFERVRHEVQTHALQNYQNRTKKCSSDKLKERGMYP